MSLDDDEPTPHLPKDREEAVTAWGVRGGEEGGRWWGCLPLSTHDSKTCREWGWARGVGKDNPNKHLEDILPSTPKLITVPWWH